MKWMRHLDHYVNEILEQVTSFGGMFFHLFLICFMFALGEIILSLQLFASFILTYAVTLVLRLAHFRDRPKKLAYSNIIEKVEASSFPSLHSMRVSAIFCLFYLFYGPGLVSLIFLGTALAVFLSRHWLKKHHPSDILAGAILGVLVGIFVAGLGFGGLESLVESVVLGVAG
ncbi:MAG: phosphatase PAP2 family protein [Candidatus Aenigmarchaeota archaeon]|nr:phosphatase PAP2 family protein [Candidatus Aenigmarchaeota archaeon]